MLSRRKKIVRYEVEKERNKLRDSLRKQKRARLCAEKMKTQRERGQQNTQKREGSSEKSEGKVRTTDRGRGETGAGKEG